MPSKTRALLHQGRWVQHLPQPRMPHAHGSVRPPCRLEGHSGRDLVALDADLVKEIDRRAVSSMTYSVSAIVGPHQAHTGLIIGRKRYAIAACPPRLVPEPHTFSFAAARAGDEKSTCHCDMPAVTGESAREREAEAATIG